MSGEEKNVDEHHHQTGHTGISSSTSETEASDGVSQDDDRSYARAHSLPDHVFDNLKQKKKPLSGLTGYDTPNTRSEFSSSPYKPRNRNYPTTSMILSSPQRSTHDTSLFHSNSSPIPIPSSTSSPLKPPPSPLPPAPLPLLAPSVSLRVLPLPPSDSSLAPPSTTIRDSDGVPNSSSTSRTCFGSSPVQTTITVPPPSLGKPSKKNSLEDDVLTQSELEFSQSLMSFTSSTTITNAAAEAAAGGSMMMGGLLLPAPGASAKKSSEPPCLRNAAAPRNNNNTLGRAALAQSKSSSDGSDVSRPALSERKSSVRFHLPKETTATTKTTTTTSGGGGGERSRPGTATNHQSAEEDDKQLQKAILASTQEQQQQQQQQMATMSPDELEKADELARNLWEAASNDFPPENTEIIQFMLNEARTLLTQIEQCVNVAANSNSGSGGGADLGLLLGLNDALTNSIIFAEKAIEGDTKPPPNPEPGSSHDIRNAVENKDIFTIICTLRVSQYSRRLDAALSLLRFARGSAGGGEEEIKICNDIRSSGGLHSLLTVFRTRGAVYELKVVAALAVAYLLPRFILSSPDLPNTMSLKVVESLRFLTAVDRVVSPNGRHIAEQVSVEECFRVATEALAMFWENHLGPKLHQQSSHDMVEVEGMVDGTSDSYSLRRVRQVSRRRPGVLFDQKHETIALRELLEATVSLIVFVAKRSSAPDIMTLAEQVCAIDCAGPIAVREGILQILVEWLKQTDGSAATRAMCYLTSIQDKYMAGWIHSELVNKGAVAALAELAYRSYIMHDVRLAVAKILAPLCAAPHTRAAVVEANCIGFLITFLYDESSEPSSEQLMMFAGSALVQLAAGSITRAVILSGEDTDFRDPVSLDKRDTLIKDIVEQGVIAPFVAIARDRKGRLRSVAVEALRVLSEDVSPSCHTRLRLCEAGAVEVLGRTLNDDVSLLHNEGGSLSLMFRSLSEEKLKHISQALSALANILDPAHHSTTSHDRNANIVPDMDFRINGCLDMATSGGLDSILKIASLPLIINGDEEYSPAQRSWAVNLVEESCRSLASISPYLLTSPVAEAGFAYGAHGALNGFYAVLKQLVNTVDMDKDTATSDLDEQMKDLIEVVLQGLGTLAKSEPLKTRMVDRCLPYLMRLVGGRDSRETSNSVREALQSLDVAADEIVVQVAGNNSNLFADWFCLRRSLLIQAMARAEIRQVVRRIWEKPFSEIETFKRTKLIRDPFVASGDEKHPMTLFSNFPDDETTIEKQEQLSRQYYDIYGRPSSLETGAEDIAGPEVGLLWNHIYPLNSSSSEKEWVLKHHAFQETGPAGLSGLLSKHVDLLLSSFFPSKLLRDEVIPVRCLRPEASFDFRALMMPQRRYFSFSREGKLVARICDEEASKFGQQNVHWTLGFTNSAFFGDFSESLVQLLYLYPMIRGLSFSSTSDVEDKGQDYEDSAVGDGGETLATLVGSLPGSVSHLTFDGILKEDDLNVLVRLLETLGKLTCVQGDSSTNAQGKFSFFAIKRTPDVSAEVWRSLFNLLGDSDLFVSSWTGPNSCPRKPLTCLKSLDLSFNDLGDELCASVLRIVLNDESSRYLEHLDLSGNCIKRGSEVVKRLRRVADTYDTKRGTRASLRTLRLASNNLSFGFAWLDVIATIQNEAFCLRYLDLSSNEIILGDTQHSQKEHLIRRLLGNANLETIDLSGNRLSSSTVDDVIQELDSSDCGIGFLLLENNDPNLTPEQTKRLESFRIKSRRVLLSKLGQRRIDENEEKKPAEVEEEPSRHSVDIIPEIPDTTPVDSDNLITVMFSAPLVYRENNDSLLRTFPKLNLDVERELIWQCLKEASRDIDLTYDNATYDRLLAAMTRRCTCLHYSGHGHPNYLPFEESGTGYPKWFPVKEFHSLIERQGSAPFSFVSACHSGLAGETFVSAGVPHVVCCQQEHELKDVAALAFTKQFYLALAMGRTVRESFEQGRRAVRHSSLKSAEVEMRKFMLLPEDGNHDVPIFNARRVQEWPPSRRRGRIDELAVRNLIQEDPAPAPPEFFVGREVEMHKVFKAVWERRLVSVIGDPGIGRSSLVAATCHYINQRRNTVAEKIERIYHVSANRHRKKDRFLALMLQLLKRLITEGRAQPVEDEDDGESIIEAICHALRNAKALLVFDRVEILEDAEEWSKFPMMIQELLRETANVKILITNKESLGIPKLQEFHIRLGPLSLINTVKLFGHVCPFIHTPGQRRQLVKSLLPNSEDEDDPEGQLLFSESLEQPAKAIFQHIGEGVPTRIENAAYCIDKERALPILMDGSIRDQ